MRTQPLAIPKIAASIYLVRVQKVMMDHPGFNFPLIRGSQGGPNVIFSKMDRHWGSDLAVLYGAEKKYLKRQVNRHKERFPDDFVYFRTKKECENLRCQIGTSSWGGSRYRPYAFTEHGILMLSSVLNSRRAIQVNIAIMRVFARIRQVLLESTDLALGIEKLERHVEGHGKDIRSLFDFVE